MKHTLKLKALEYGWWLLLLCPLLLHNQSLTEAINTIWVRPFASHILINWYTVLILLILWLTALWPIKTWRLIKLFLILYFEVGLLLCLTWKSWSFQRPNIYILLIGFIAILLFICYNILSKKKSDNNTLDLPKDSLGRTDFAKEIVKKILSVKAQNKSFNIAFMGEWGSGKSILLTLIKKEFTQKNLENSENITIVNYIPWQIPDESKFALELLKLIKGHSNEWMINKLINELIILLQQDSDNFIFKIYSQLIRYSTNEKVTNIKQELGQLLNDKGHKIVVLLDDLDRLNKEEILELFRLIRNTLDIQNLHFIVGFDRDHIKKILELDDKFDAYIGKYFDIRIDLPSIDPKDYFFNKLKEKLSSSEKLKEEALHQMHNVSNYFTEKIHNPRDADNIIESFIFIYAKLNYNCDYHTLLELEIVRHLNYNTYKKLKYSNTEKKIEDIIKDDTDAKQILRESSLARWPIKSIRYYNKYFMYANSKKEIDSSEFNNMLNKESAKEMESYFEMLIKEDKFDDLYKKLSDFIKERNSANKVINLDSLLVIINCLIKYNEDDISNELLGFFNNRKINKDGIVSNNIYKKINDLYLSYSIGSNYLREYDIIKYSKFTLRFIKDKLTRNLFIDNSLYKIYLEYGSWIDQQRKAMENDDVKIVDLNKIKLDIINEIYKYQRINLRVYLKNFLILNKHPDEFALFRFESTNTNHVDLLFAAVDDDRSLNNKEKDELKAFLSSYKKNEYIPVKFNFNNFILNKN